MRSCDSQDGEAIREEMKVCDLGTSKGAEKSTSLDPREATKVPGSHQAARLICVAFQVCVFPSRTQLWGEDSMSGHFSPTCVMLLQSRVFSSSLLLSTLHCSGQCVIRVHSSSQTSCTNTRIGDFRDCQQ